MTDPVVLAFSGGLDTSFCVPWLREQGYDVHTLFVDTGGVSREEVASIEKRALALGAVKHHCVDASNEVWDEVLVPLIRSGGWYQSQYPLLCSDRYVIVKASLALCDKLGTRNFAHGCTGMGNDQVRFDLTVRTLGNYNIIAPIRAIQKKDLNVREYEKAKLEELGFDVPDKTDRYTINENLMGVTLSGSEIDQWQEPDEAARVLTRSPGDWPSEPLRVKVTFEQGVPVKLDGKAMSGPEILSTLNHQFGAYGVGRGLYTGDTTVGLKGRIVFEAPGITALHAAHRALEEATSPLQENSFKDSVSTMWIELVYQGFFYDPLKRDLEAYLTQSQSCVNGTVTVHTAGGMAQAVAIESPHLLTTSNAGYAQTCDWTVEEAEGFIKLFGQSSALWAEVNGASKTD
ncbi:MAG: argininosuccinate synthase [Gammaproteobacteria bacterium]